MFDKYKENPHLFFYFKAAGNDKKVVSGRLILTFAFDVQNIMLTVLLSVVQKMGNRMNENSMTLVTATIAMGVMTI